MPMSMKKYLEIYDEKMKIQEQEIANIKEQISILDNDIANLEVKIADKQKEVDAGIEQFKQRLRVMYMTGNDSIASMLVGSTDFMISLHVPSWYRGYHVTIMT